jgi:hypothetical protein
MIKGVFKTILIKKTIFIEKGILVIIYKCSYNARMKYVAL